jgi:hypothetical protein
VLACDLIMEVRASRSVSAEQAARVERMVFGGGRPAAEQIELILAMDGYVERADPCWDDLVARAAAASVSARLDGAAKKQPAN